MRKFLLSLLLGMASLACYAEVVPEPQAAATASRFFNKGQSAPARLAPLPLQLVWKGRTAVTRSASADAPSFYVYNRGNNQGFVIVAGDDAVRPILAYAHVGAFEVENMPENLKGWMTYLDEQIHTVRRLNIEPTEETIQAWSDLNTGESEVKLDTPKWDQEDPYNRKCPGFDGWHGYVGCTITATAIILGYHQWPDCGVGELSGYYTSGLGLDVPGITLGHPYLWERMPEIDKENKYSDAERGDAISTLMLDLGVMAKARYDYTVTSASPDRVALKLPVHMKYHDGLMLANGVYFSDNSWRTLLKSELDAGRPVFYTGYNPENEGHAFVLDGYDKNGCFSVNWGWSGRSDGYYDLDKLYPGSQGAGGYEGGYSSNPLAILRIQPLRPDYPIQEYEEMVYAQQNVAGSMVSPGICVTSGETDFTQGCSFTLSVGSFMNLSTYHLVSFLKVAVTDAEGNIKRELYTTPGQRDMMPGNVMMPLYEARDYVTVTLEDPVAAGDRIRLLYLSKSGSWKPVTSSDADVAWEIVLKEGNEPAEKMDPEIGFDVTELEATIGDVFEAPVLINPYNVEVMYSSDNTDIALVDAVTGKVTLVAEGKATITAKSVEDDRFKGASASYVLSVKKAVGLDSVIYDNDPKRVAYDLQGRRVNHPSKGIYIVRGKKVYID